MGCSDHEDNEKAVTFTDGELKGKKEVEHKTVTLQVRNKTNLNINVSSSKFDEDNKKYLI